MKYRKILLLTAELVRGCTNAQCRISGKSAHPRWLPAPEYLALYSREVVNVPLGFFERRHSPNGTPAVEAALL